MSASTIHEVRLPSVTIVRKGRRIEHGRLVAKAMRSFEAVFANAYPYDAPFTSLVSRRTILAPVLDQFDVDQFSALAAAAGEVDELAFYFATVGEYPDRAENHWPNRELADLWLIPFTDYESYQRTSEFTTNALWSPSSRWGILISHEWFAVVAGVDVFMNELLEKYPPVVRGDGDGVVPAISQVDLLIEDVKTWEDRSWLRDLLVHVHGLDHARRLLKQHDLTELAP